MSSCDAPIPREVSPLHGGGDEVGSGRAERHYAPPQRREQETEKQKDFPILTGSGWPLYSQSLDFVCDIEANKEKNVLGSRVLGVK